jgi:hypothetical protein
VVVGEGTGMGIKQQGNRTYKEGKMLVVIEIVRGHPSISLSPLSSPTLPLFICIPFPHLCTISRDYT